MKRLAIVVFTLSLWCTPYAQTPAPLQDIQHSIEAAFNQSFATQQSQIAPLIQGLAQSHTEDPDPWLVYWQAYGFYREAIFYMNMEQEKAARQAVEAGIDLLEAQDNLNAESHEWVELGERLWSLDVPEWGIWGVSETDVQMLPEDMTGLRTIELGCGTGYVSGWMARRGAVASGIDVSENQLATARDLARKNGVDLDLMEGNAEATGLPDAAFDFAISEYGAAIWCDPSVWIAEAHRILKPGGRLRFLGNHPLMMITTPLNGADCERTFHRPYRGLCRIDWTEVEIDPSGVTFTPTVGDWFRLFHKVGFVVEDYKELYAPEGNTDPRFGVPADWGVDFPSEQVWMVRKI